MRVCDICRKESNHTIILDNGIEQYDLCDEHFDQVKAVITQAYPPSEEKPAPPEEKPEKDKKPAARKSQKNPSNKD